MDLNELIKQLTADRDALMAQVVMYDELLREAKRNDEEADFNFNGAMWNERADALINQANKLCTGQIKGLDVDNSIGSQKLYFDTKTLHDFVLLPKNLTKTLLVELTNGDSSKNSIMKLRYAQLISAAERDGFILSSVMQDGWNSFSREPQQCLAEIKAEAVESAIKYCNLYLAFPVTKGDVAEEVLAISEIKMYATKVRQGGE